MPWKVSEMVTADVAGVRTWHSSNLNPNVCGLANLASVFVIVQVYETHANIDM
jgi:hypothetical protein